MMDKEAAISTSDTSITFLIGAALLGITFIGFTVTTALIEHSKTRQYQPIQQKLASARLLYSQHCLALETKDRRYPGIIDTDKITTERLDACLKRADSDPQPLKIILDHDDSTVKTASTSTWDSTAAQRVTQETYPVSINKESIGFLTIFQK